MAISRRTFVKFGAGGALLLALGGVGLSLRSTVMREARVPLQVLSESEFSILAALADRVAPSNRPFPSAYALHVPEKVDALLATLDPGTVDELKQALALLENAAAGLLLDGRTTTFTGAKPEAQDDIMRAWQTSRIQVRRVAMRALVGICAATYWSSPEIHAHVGYPGPPAFAGAPT